MISDVATARDVKSDRGHRTRKRSPRCVICGSGRNVEHHHIGGRNHLAWITVPMCVQHHRQLHGLLEQAGIDLRYTSDAVKRLSRAIGAISVFLCMLYNSLQENLAVRR